MTDTSNIAVEYNWELTNRSSIFDIRTSWPWQQQELVDALCIT